MRNINLLIVLIMLLTTQVSYGIEINTTDVRNADRLFRAYGKQQIIQKDSKGNRILITPNYNNYSDRNNNVSEKIVAIYDKHSPAYGYRYVLYTPIGNYVGHHKIMQRSSNGIGYEPIPDGGEGSKTPCFRSLTEAKHAYYSQWY